MSSRKQTKTCIVEYKRFGEYYADPDFKERHLEKLNEKLECEKCHRVTSRVNLTRHKRSNICSKYEKLLIKV